MSDKIFHKRDNLFGLLTSNKNIKPSSLDSNIFSEKTYTSLISPYTCLIASGIDSVSNKKTYNEETDFSLFIECNVIDASISNCLYLYISAFEKRFRNFVIETLCSKIFNDGDLACTDISKIRRYVNGERIFDFIDFNDTPSLDDSRNKANEIADEQQKQAEFLKISNIQSNILSKRRSSFESLINCVDIAKAKKSELDKHYIDKYGNIPLYIGMHSLTFGEILSIYSVFNIADKNIFMQEYYRNYSHTYSERDAYKFESRIKRINDIRNVVAHNEPIFPLIVNDKRIASLVSIFEKLKINYNNTICKPPSNISIQKFSLVTKTDFNKNSFDNVEKVISSLND